MPTITVPTRTGYTFGGYYTSSGGSGTQYYTASGTSAHKWDKTSSTATLYAKWTGNPYAVVLDRQGGSGGTENITATYGSAMPSITVPTRMGYTFGGYYTSTGGSGTQYYTATGASARWWNVTTTTTLYAKWTANTYTVTLDCQSGSGGTEIVTATYGSAMPAITIPTRTGYTFGGYYTSTDGSGTQYYTASGVSARSWDGTAAMTLYAKWTTNIFSVALDLQSGSGGTASVTATYGSAMPSITVPTRTGYTFGGYYTSTGGGGTQYYTASGASARTWDGTVTTLYAKWTANTYTITLNRQNGSGGTASVTATYGSAMPAITIPTRTGYTFGGYYTSTGGGGTQYYTASGASARNWDETVATTLYAKWTITPSSNDDFANASVISGTSGSATGTTVGATREDGDPVPSAQSSVGGTIWWRWTAPASGMARFSTEGSSFDTVLAIYTGTALTALSEIASNDDGGTNRTSIVSFLASSGTTYWISVAGFGSSTGAVNLTWSETAFKYETVNGKATVTGMDGSFSGALVIPETLGGCPVTGIANNCFNAAWKGGRITSIVLPDSLESIGEFAFRQNPLESVHIPSGVTSIAGNAFRNCDGLAGISVDPANRTFRGIDGVLFSKDGKTLVLCPEGRSGRYSVPDGVTAISDMAFDSCERLSAVTLPSSLQTIGKMAFDYCLGLTEITIPANVSEIGVGAFQECYGLLAISVDEGNEAFCGVDGVLLSKDGRWLMACPGGKSGAYAIPVGVRAIDQNAFVGCRQLTSVAVPRTVSYICGTAFYGCDGLTSITMSDGLSTIGEGAFYGCTGLSSLTIPASVIFIGDYAFLGCNSLERLALPSAFEGRTDGMGIPEGCEVVFDSFEPVDVHRFYSKAYRGHFFTISEAEKDDLIAHNPNWKYEGTAYRAFKTQASGTVPLYRFYSKGYRGHFFTIDAEEAESVKSNRNWKYEGIAYYVYPEKVEGSVPVFRFWSKGYRHHFYTTNEAEKEDIEANNPNWKYEGIAFYALPAEETGQGRAVASGAPEGGAFGERALPEAEGDVLDGGTPGGRALQETGGVVIRGAGVFPMGAWTIEVREEAPDAEELSAGLDERPTPSAFPTLHVALPEGAAAVSLWSASAGPVSENANPGPEAEFIPEAVGTWHWLRAVDEKGKNVLSLWIRLLP